MYHFYLLQQIVYCFEGIHRARTIEGGASQRNRADRGRTAASLPEGWNAAAEAWLETNLDILLVPLRGLRNNILQYYYSVMVSTTN